MLMNAWMTRHFTTVAPLVGIVLVVVGLLVVDLVTTSRVNADSAEIVENAMRSIDLVNEMRRLAWRLRRDRPKEEQAVILAQFAESGRQYESLATYPGEYDAWEPLKRTLNSLQRDIDAKDDGRLHDDLQMIELSVNKLVEINREGAEGNVARIRELGKKESLIDAGAVILAIVLISWIGGARLRSLARERTLTEKNVALVEERNRELDAFASRAAHDLRAPLNPIRGYADLILLGDEPPEEMRRLAARIRTGVDRMVRVVEDMLELSRFGHPAPGCASIADVCAEVLEELGPDLREATCSTALTSEMVKCSPGVMSQILRNLIGNAVKYRSPSRPLEIKVAARVVDGEVIVDVVDNGVGIDPESAKHAFEPFFRARSDVAGHGIGLAIVDKAVRSQGGSCELRSNLDQGTRVTVRLPRAVV